MLLDDAALHCSSVVANCAMNRERQLTGVNSYARVLGFDPVAAVRAAGADAAWLDLCCGTGRALIQAAARVREEAPARVGENGGPDRLTLVGIDLVDTFPPTTFPPTKPDAGLTLIAAPIETWTPSRAFDLITCVHGLHYIGDKLAVLARVARWLTPTGRFVADLDLASIRLADGRPAGRRLSAALRAAGFAYDARRHRIGRTGPGELDLPYRYLGADDRAGANYTGQPAVHSYYRHR